MGVIYVRLGRGQMEDATSSREGDWDVGLAEDTSEGQPIS